MADIPTRQNATKLDATQQNAAGQWPSVALGTSALLLFGAGGAGAVVGTTGLAALAAPALAGAGGLCLAAAIAARRRRTKVAGLAGEEAGGDIAALAERLNFIEQRLGEVERHGGAGTQASIGELTAEIALLGGLTKDLAEAIASHDIDIAALGRSGDAGPPPGLLEGATPGAEAHPAASNEGAAATQPGLSAPAVLPYAATARDRSVREADAARAEAIVRAVSEDRLSLHLQPIVSLPQRRVLIYEALSRLDVGDGEPLTPAEFLPLAERRGLAAAFDERTFKRVLAVARHLAAHSGVASVACNLSPVSLAEPGFLKAITRQVEGHLDIVDRLIVELPQRAFRALDADRAAALAGLVERGVHLAMDRVQDLRIDPSTLAERGVRYVKIPAGMLLDGGAAAGAAVHSGDLPAMLARAGIAVVAERIETEATVADILDIDVPLGQGFLFGPPRPVRDDVLAPPARQAALPSASQAPVPERDGPAAKATPDAALRATGRPLPVPPPERKPFRAFLRRASA